MVFKLVIFLFLFSFSSSAQVGFNHYSSFSKLKANHKEGKDFKIIFKDRLKKDKTRTLVMAMHGCKVEQGTTELSEAIAGEKYSYYSFCGLKEEKKYPELLLDPLLHITSAHFDEPKLMEMVNKCDRCLSIHGFSNDGVDFCIGGRNDVRRAELLKSLLRDFPEFKSCELCCKPYLGISKKNPVNLCKTPGVQIEMSARVRKKILEDSEFKKKLAQAMR
ncbi:MAG: poly-gamma-glutamate hydrolase family protein [Xanthomonadaceae bacterium]|nr:poly-gamma-glutamate hydrolase family protein [Xanthomonadaceae bacterium]